MQTHPNKRRNINISGLLQSAWRGSMLKKPRTAKFQNLKTCNFSTFFLFCFVDRVVLKAKHMFEGNKKSCSSNFHSADTSSPRLSSDGISESLQFHPDSFCFIIFLFSIKFFSWSHEPFSIVPPWSKHDERGNLLSLRPSSRRTWKRRPRLRTVCWFFLVAAAEILLTPTFPEATCHHDLILNFLLKAKMETAAQWRREKVGKAED